MKMNRICKILVAVVLMLTVSLSIPSTLAKYTDKKSYSIAVSSAVVIDFGKNKATGVGAATPASLSYKAPETGYYAIVAKGGNGSDGMYGKEIQYSSQYGGTGGYIYACVYLIKGEQITAYIGNRAKDPSFADSRKADEKKNLQGVGGINGLNCCTGAKGNYYDSRLSGSTGAAGGAGTCIVSNGANLLAVAGGGGGGGSADSSLGTIFANKGGGGGAGGNMSSASAIDGSFIVFNGSNGGGDGNRKGKAGTTSAGAGGESGNGDGHEGTKMSGLTGGNGGNPNVFGGGGGGGYAGGGGGAGNGNAAAAGGGGGASSAILRTNNGKPSLKLNPSVLSKVFELVGYDSNFSNYSGGFAIIAYLDDGTNTAKYSGGSF